jgi:hypothetical protein
MLFACLQQTIEMGPGGMKVQPPLALEKPKQKIRLSLLTATLVKIICASAACYDPQISLALCGIVALA